MGVSTSVSETDDHDVAGAASFIEVQFPVSKLSKESYKERKAGDSQTLNSLGKWHGRKPLVLVRALLLGLLLPATENPHRDREVFLKLMTMDDEGMWRRCKGLSAREAAEHLTPSEREEAIEERENGQTAWKRGLADSQKKSFQKRAFLRMGYDERLTHCLRPEEIDGPDEAAWDDINAHLGTSARSLRDLVRELGIRRFGHVPRVGDAFAGGGSIPFEAARLGCDVFANDLNPVAALQCYGALNIIGGPPETMEKVKEAQREVYEAVRRQVAEWGIERNEFGWEADVFLYCAEVKDRITGWRVPLLPNLAVDPKRGVIAELSPNHATGTIDIAIRTGATAEEVGRASSKDEGTAADGVRSPFDRDGNLIPMALRQRTSSRALRGPEGLRQWERHEWKPRPDDVYQERLYCIRWILPDLERLMAIEQVLSANPDQTVDGWVHSSIGPAVDAQAGLLSPEDAACVAAARAIRWPGEARQLLRTMDACNGLLPGQQWGDASARELAAELARARRALPPEVQAALEIARARRQRHYAAPTEADIERERRCEELLAERFEEWQHSGFLPSRRIQPGKALKDPMRNRGWMYWHQLYTPRQLLINGLFGSQNASATGGTSVSAGLLLAQMKLADWNGKLCRWDSSRTVCQQALYAVVRPSPYANHACRGSLQLRSIFQINAASESVGGRSAIALGDASTLDSEAHLWITDPGYGDMAPYAEYSEFYLAWLDSLLPAAFPGWYADSKRALAVELADEGFAQILNRCYTNLTEHMPQDGVQVVMFTSWDTQVWAELTLLLWAAGLKVIQAWTIATETEPGAKEGGGSTVQGTVCLVLKKRAGGQRGDLSEIRPEVQMEVRRQLQVMLDLDDRESPNFSDSDYTLAAYAAALRVITRYDRIAEIDVKRELERGGRPDPGGIVRGVIEQALKVATDFLVPEGLDRSVWKDCCAEERLYLKGVEVEAHGERRCGVYQEFARGFGVREYRDLLQSDAANETRLRTPSELKGRDLESGPMGGKVLRRVLYAIYQTVEEAMDPAPAVNWLRGKYPAMTFFDVRQRMVRMLQYLASKPGGEQMPHWKKDSEAAYLLAARLENES